MNLFRIAARVADDSKRKGEAAGFAWAKSLPSKEALGLTTLGRGGPPVFKSGTQEFIEEAGRDAALAAGFDPETGEKFVDGFLAGASSALRT